jgi:hypothetical protein
MANEQFEAWYFKGKPELHAVRHKAVGDSLPIAPVIIHRVRPELLGPRLSSTRTRHGNERAMVDLNSCVIVSTRRVQGTRSPALLCMLFDVEILRERGYS